MIVSASRRTDLPAFYMDWFMARVAAGRVLVRNPYDATKLRTVVLDPEAVEAIVFWTKDPRPALAFLPELDERGYRYLFQVTLTGYPSSLEPRTPEPAEAVSTLLRLSERIGPERIVWRYDPVIVGGRAERRLDWGYHRRNFPALARLLSGVARRAVVSLYDDYPSTTKRLAGVLGGPSEAQIAEDGTLSEDAAAGLRDLAAAAESEGFDLRSCAEPSVLESCGIRAGACVDGELLERLWGLRVSPGRDRGQRPLCNCAPSVDIGAYGTCPAGCAYCYAVRGRGPSPALAGGEPRNREFL